MDDLGLILTCEHGGNDVPEEYAHLFTDAKADLESHRGIDIGILPFARDFAERIEEPLFYSTVTRLLVDLNRSDHNPAVLSEYTRKLNKEERKQLLKDYFYPYRMLVRRSVSNLLRQHRIVLHLTFHSFTHELYGKVRPPIALLYDGSNHRERTFSAHWQKLLKRRMGLTVRRNFPYRGHTDGQTTYLRRIFANRPYLGICLELNQRDLQNGCGPEWLDPMVETFQEALGILEIL